MEEIKEFKCNMEEIPFSNTALKIYIDEVDKRLAILAPSISEFNKLKLRRKKAQDRLAIHRTAL